MLLNNMVLGILHVFVVDFMQWIEMKIGIEQKHIMI